MYLCVSGIVLTSVSTMFEWALEYILQGGNFCFSFIYHTI